MKLPNYLLNPYLTDSGSTCLRIARSFDHDVHRKQHSDRRIFRKTIIASASGPTESCCDGWASPSRDDMRALHVSSFEDAVA